MSKEEIKLILEALEGADWYINQLEMIVYSADDAGTQENRLKVQQAITVMRLEIDAQNMASKPAQQEPFGFAVMENPIAPPVQRTWVGLTDEEIVQLHYEIKVRFMGTYKTEDIYRAVEAKLQEKNA